MSLLPVSVTRTSNILTNQRLTTQLQKDQLDLQKLYNQLSTGRRLEVASDDAPAATRANLLRQSLLNSEQLIRNAQASQRFLNTTDSILADVGGTLIESRATANSVAQTVLSDEERTNYADSLLLAVNKLVDDGNRTFEGHSLLAGVQSGPTLTAIKDYVRVNANETILQSFLTSGRATPQSSNAFNAYGLAGNPVQSNVDLRPAISNATMLADLNDGSGIEISRFRLFDPQGGQWKTIDLTGLQTVGELIQRVESIQIDGRDLNVEIVDQRLTLNYADGLPGNLAVDESLGSQAAKQLGWLNASGFGTLPLGDHDLEPLLSIHTPLTELANGAGVDLSGGLVVQQGNESYRIDLSQARTMGDVLIAMNRSQADVHAFIDPGSRRLTVQSLRSGVDFGIGENGGTAAAQLGIRTATGLTQLGDLRYGRGIQEIDGAEFWITRTDGTELGIDLTGVTDIDGVLATINNHPDNVGPAQVTASLATVGNGIVLTSAEGTTSLAVRAHEASDAAAGLGLVPFGQASATAQTAAGISTLAGTNYAGRESGGIIDQLLRLESASRSKDFGEIERLQKLLDNSLDNLNSIRGDLGIQTQAAEATETQLEDETVLLKEGISENLDADLAEVISQVTLRQAAMQASLQLMGQISRVSLLDYL